MKRLPLATLLVLLTASARAQMPDGAQRILKDMDATIDAAHKKAAQQLQSVQEFETRRGNLAGALAVQQKIAELTGMPVTAAVPVAAPTVTGTPTAPPGAGRGTFVIDSRSDTGTLIGPAKKGQRVSVQYVDGLWRTTNGGEKVSRYRQTAMPFAQGDAGGRRGRDETETIAVIPGGTKGRAYVEALKKDYKEIRGGINDTVQGG